MNAISAYANTLPRASLFCVLAALISNCAGCLASWLTRCLTLSASALLHRLFIVSGSQCLYVLHTNCLLIYSLQLYVVYHKICLSQSTFWFLCHFFYIIFVRLYIATFTALHGMQIKMFTIAAFPESMSWTLPHTDSATTQASQISRAQSTCLFLYLNKAFPQGLTRLILPSLLLTHSLAANSPPLLPYPPLSLWLPEIHGLLLTEKWTGKYILRWND